MLTEDKKLYGWGDGTYGELGLDEELLPCEEPREIKVECDVIKQIAVGARHSMVLDHKGVIYVMGDNSND